MRSSTALIPLLLVLPALAQDSPESLGKARAAASRHVWEVRDAQHPVLGNIRFAFLKSAVETPVGGSKVYSRAYVSCVKGVDKFAIELTNATAPDDPKGLKANADPRLFCNRPGGPGESRLVREPILANWQMNTLGDALAYGFRAFPLRECASIDVVQEVSLPAGWSQKSAKVEFSITPYNRELDQVFVTCGAETAYKDAAPAKVATAPAPPKAIPPPAATTPVKSAPPPPPPPAQPPKVGAAASPATSGSWQPARVLTTGKTNVRAEPSTASRIVIELHPGMPVLVQSTGSDWYRAKSSSGTPFEGFIRQDRLQLK